MILLTEGYTLATYPEMIMWAIATLAFILLCLFGYRSKKLWLKITLFIIGILGGMLCAVITYGCYIEASGQMIE